MIHTGRIQELTILRRTDAGLYLGDGQANEVLLPNKYVPGDFKFGESITVFVHRDSEDRQVATTRETMFRLDGFAPLKVSAVTRNGAFVDIGLEKDLLVPFGEQERKLEEGRWYVVYMGVDEKTDRLYGSTRIEKHLDNTELALRRGDAVELLVYGRSELGWSVIVNGKHQGLLHNSEVFRPIAIGDHLPGFIKQVRPDHKLDITLQALGYRRYNDANVELLAKRIQQKGGFLALTDKSAPEEIQHELGISKKAFKQALGALYKARQVSLGEDGITWLG